MCIRHFAVFKLQTLVSLLNMLAIILKDCLEIKL